MSKRLRESGDRNQLKEFLLNFARAGDFEKLIQAIDCVRNDNDMLHEIWNEYTVTMLRMYNDFRTARAQFVADLKK